jgi:hypothetical protein
MFVQFIDVVLDDSHLKFEPLSRSIFKDSFRYVSLLSAFQHTLKGGKGPISEFCLENTDNKFGRFLCTTFASTSTLKTKLTF